ncbi:hypothetical protein [Nonomuraea turkmeniaca]|nr:hypothetical protein [Nonomuraea turkmeniaca]
MTAADFNDRCAEAFACHALRLEVDDALEIAAEFLHFPRQAARPAVQG